MNITPMQSFAAGLVVAAIATAAVMAQTVTNPSDVVPPLEMVGSVAPISGDGRDGDGWMNLTDLAQYKKVSGSWVQVPVSQQIKATTAVDGSYTFVFPMTFSAAPICQATAQATFGTTDVVNVQFDGAPTTTQAKVRVTRTQQSVVALLGLTILSIPASIGAQVITIRCDGP